MATPLAASSPKGGLALLAASGVSLVDTGDVDFGPFQVYFSRRYEKRYATFVIKVNSATTAVVNFHLYGALTEGGTPFLLKSAIVTAFGTTPGTSVGVIDLNEYKMPYYYVRAVTTADESGDSVDIHVVN